MVLKASGQIFAMLLLALPLVAADEPTRTANQSQSTSQDLAEWIDAEFEQAWKAEKLTPPDLTDDATFLKRVFLDVNGTLPSVSQAREFLNFEASHKRGILVDRLLNDTRRPDRFAERSAAHWATTWRRMVATGNSQEARAAVALEPWLKEQFASNVSYDQIARRIITASNTNADSTLASPRPGMTAGSGPVLFYQVTGGKPQTSASAVSRVFLGVRVGCAECHDHPFAKWKMKDFWGMAAFFAGVNNGAVADVAVPTIRGQDQNIVYAAAFPDGQEAKVPGGKTPREVLADWIVADDNSMFAATAVNRTWMGLMGRGLTDSVDDLDKASPAERQFLDKLARRFVEARFDLHWLIAGICKSQVYQRACVTLDDQTQEPPPGFRVVKTLIPEQVYNSLEQALGLPVAKVEGSARYNGLRDQLISRMNEAATAQPAEFRAGIPQALLLMNGRLTTDATDLGKSRTLRGVLDAPFLNSEEKLATLFLAVLSRSPRSEETEFLLEHVSRHSDADKQQQAYAEIFWSLLNSPEFVLER